MGGELSLTEKFLCMGCCPNCDDELSEIQEDILGETEEIEGEPNVRLGSCPNCGYPLRIYIMVDLVELESGFQPNKVS
jgi:hypothetical protein